MGQALTMTETQPDEVKVVVDQLRAMQPSPLLGSRENGVSLWAWAEDVAADLHGRLPTLEIIVGFLRYPERTPERQVDFDARYARIPGLDPTRVEVALDGPLTVASGYDGHHQLVVTNHTHLPIVVWTNGRITAHVVDPSSGRVVGISTMAQTLPGVHFRAESNQSVGIPLVVGTASVDPGLGYAVPVGVWDLRADIELAEGLATSLTHYLTPPMRFEIL